LPGYEHILVMVDYVSKWVESMPCVDVKSAAHAKHTAS
jgi:hypothetical protein